MINQGLRTILQQPQSYLIVIELCSEAFSSCLSQKSSHTERLPSPPYAEQSRQDETQMRPARTHQGTDEAAPILCYSEPYLH